MRERLFGKGMTLRRGDTYLAFTLATLLLIIFVLFTSFLNMPETTREGQMLASEVGFALLFLVPLIGVFFILFSLARKSEMSEFELFVEKGGIGLFIATVLVMAVLILLGELSAVNEYEPLLRVLAWTVTFLAGLFFILSFPLKKSLLLFVAAAVFVVLAILPYHNFVATLLRNAPIFWVLSFTPFIATAPALFEYFIRLRRGHSAIHGRH
jgi:hypothetical protein